MSLPYTPSPAPEHYGALTDLGEGHEATEMESLPVNTIPTAATGGAHSGPHVTLTSPCRASTAPLTHEETGSCGGGTPEVRPAAVVTRVSPLGVCGPPACLGPPQGFRTPPMRVGCQGGGTEGCCALVPSFLPSPPHSLTPWLILSVVHFFMCPLWEAWGQELEPTKLTTSSGRRSREPRPEA